MILRGWPPLFLGFVSACLVLGSWLFPISSSADEQLPAAEMEQGMELLEHPSSSPWKLGVLGGFEGGEVWYKIGGRIEGLPWFSKLVFPLNVPVVGVCYEYWRYEPSGWPDLGLEISTSIRVDEPNGSMTDTDSYPVPMVIGYTESKAKLNAWSADLCAKKSIHHFASARMGEGMLFLVGGVMWDSFSYTILGLTGSYRFPLPEGPVWVGDDEEVLTYRLDCGMIYVGLEAQWSLGRSCSLAAEIAAGAVRMSDEDHHLMREKFARGSAVGTATRMGLAAAVEPERWQRKNGGGWFLKGKAEMLAAAASGSQEQRFLDGSEPAVVWVGEDVGIQQGRISLAVGCRF